VHERGEDRVIVEGHVGDLIQRLAPNVNVRVAQGASPVVGGGEILANAAAKRQDAVSRYRATQIGS